MTRIIPFKKEHLDCMDMREHERTVLAASNLLETLTASSIAFTGIVNGRVIACGGLTPINNGSAEIWLIPSIWVSDVSMTFAREIRKWVEYMRKDLSLCRMQTACLNDDLHTRWMRFLGFEKEGVMKKFYDGVDFCMWGKTWE